MQWYTHILLRGSTEPRKQRSKWWLLWHYYTALRRRLTFTCFCFVFVFVWKCIRIDTGVYGLADSGREDPGGERGRLLAKTQRHVPLLRREVKGLIFLSFHFCWIFFFSLHPPFKTNSHISLAKNLEVEGSSRWCRACLGRTWRTCNPEADLERVEPHFHWSVNVIIRGKVGEKKQWNMGASIKGWAETTHADGLFWPSAQARECWTHVLDIRLSTETRCIKQIIKKKISLRLPMKQEVNGAEKQSYTVLMNSWNILGPSGGRRKGCFWAFRPSLPYSKLLFFTFSSSKFKQPKHVFREKTKTKEKTNIC